jgi:anti-sigma B factor antagonist
VSPDRREENQPVIIKQGKEKKMSLSINIENKITGYCFITLNGRLDGTTSPECDARITSLLTPATKTIIFDMTNLNYISSMGLRVFLKTRRIVEGHGGCVYMINVQPQIEKVFEIANILKGMKLFASMKEADDYFDSMQKNVLESLK